MNIQEFTTSVVTYCTVVISVILIKKDTFLLKPSKKSDEKSESESSSRRLFNFKSGGEVVSSVGILPGAAWTLVEVMG